jgi:transcriptional regulator with XRE-family HTH domain
MRRRAGLTQRDLARKLGREHSFVWRIETGERRLDVIEFHWVCQALGQDTTTVYGNLIRAIAAGETAAPFPHPVHPC